MKVQQSVVVISCLPYVIDRVKSYTNDVPNDIKLFDIRILFLITALNTSTRDIIKNDLYGDVYLIKILEEFMIQNQDNETIVVDKVKISHYYYHCVIIISVYHIYHIHNYIYDN